MRTAPRSPITPRPLVVVRPAYSLARRLQTVISKIKAELEGLAPDIVLPPTRNIWVHWRTFEKDALVITIDCKTRW